MKADNNSIHIAVVDSSAIVRSGMVQIIKHIPENDIYPVEISSMAGLANYLSLHAPDIVIVNPIFEGWFDVLKFKEEFPKARFAALLHSFIDANLLKYYDCEIHITESMDSIISKLMALFDDNKEEHSPEQSVLSQREKEIIVCVVKGMTNKEIAEKLFLSIHTVVTHRRNIARKLQIHSSAGLTIYAIVNKLVDVQEVNAL